MRLPVNRCHSVRNQRLKKGNNPIVPVQKNRVNGKSHKKSMNTLAGLYEKPLPRSETGSAQETPHPRRQRCRNDDVRREHFTGG